MLAYGLDNPNSMFFPIFFFICRFGCRGVTVIYVAANSNVFDVEQASTAFGLGSFFGRMCLSAAPLVSTVAQPVPLLIFTATSFASMSTVFFLKLHPKAETLSKKVKNKKKSS